MPVPERASLRLAAAGWGRGKPDGPGGLAQNGAVTRIAAAPDGGSRLPAGVPGSGSGLCHGAA